MSETESFATAPPGGDFIDLAVFQQLVLERTHDLITVVDPVGTIVYASPSWQTVTGWDPDEVIGTPVLELMHPDDQKRGADDLAAVRSGATIEAVTSRVRANDGRWVSIEWNGTPLLENDGRVAYVLGTARDVSEREELRERVGEVNAMYRVADAIARAAGLGDLFGEALDTLLEATGADRAAILLCDDQNVMRFHASRG